MAATNHLLWLLIARWACPQLKSSPGKRPSRSALTGLISVIGSWRLWQACEPTSRAARLTLLRDFNRLTAMVEDMADLPPSAFEIRGLYIDLLMSTLTMWLWEAGDGTIESRNKPSIAG